MSNETKTVETKVTQENINLDEIFADGVGASTDSVISTPEDAAKNNFFKVKDKVDMDSFTTPTKETPAEVKSEETTETTKEPVAETTETTETKTAETKAAETTGNNLIEELDQEFADEVVEEPVEKKETRGRKPINGMADIINKLIKEDKIVPFDDDKPFEEYNAKDWEELINANLEEKANQVRRETPQQFFNSLPQELQIAARYVADGGTDLKGLFGTLAQVEEHRSLDVKKEKDQEYIIREYLGATGYGSAEEIQEEIEIWKDLGKLEQQASKFKPKLDKMQEAVVAKKIQEQDLKKKQQEQASKQYMSNVYNTLKEGKLGDIKVDKKTQSLLYNGLVAPNYPSVSGKNTNLLGHLLEKYQFVEPNYTLVTEALWLLADPTGYKAKIMERGAQKSVEKTVRKLKTEQASSGGNSLGTDRREKAANKTTKKRTLPRSNNIFKRI
jgi:hypothetical protein|tara:strand:+ start:2355 stop:3689 length:1335 start_codon:yes stop_codon:yes gene_type:complete